MLHGTNRDVSVINTGYSIQSNHGIKGLYHDKEKNLTGNPGNQAKASRTVSGIPKKTWAKIFYHKITGRND